MDAIIIYEKKDGQKQEWYVRGLKYIKHPKYGHPYYEARDGLVLSGFEYDPDNPHRNGEIFSECHLTFIKDNVRQVLPLFICK